MNTGHAAIAAATAILWLGTSTLGCRGGQDDVRHYSVAKSPQPGAMRAPASGGPQGAPAATAVAPPSPAPALRWTTPEGWTSSEGGAMRLASFTVPLPEGVEGAGDGSIVRLDGSAGGLVANVNRWRGQLGLKATSPEEIEAAAKPGQAPLGEFVSFVLSNPERGQGMLAAIFNDRAATTFVKLKAPAAALAALEPAFLALCRSLTQAEAP